MTNIDQFESVFKAAAKRRFQHQPPTIQRAVLIGDQAAAEERARLADVRAFLSVLDQPREVAWEVVAGEEYDSVGDLLAKLQAIQPDLICTYRNLHMPAREHPYSLGVFVDVLTQATPTPVLLLPRRDARGRHPLPRSTETTLAITDHLTGDDRLANWAARFTVAGGTLYLTHVEDEAVFERYMQVISKIPEIDTDSAREEIEQQLLKEPRDYILSCRDVLREKGLSLNVEKIVAVGQRLSDYKRLIEEHDVDLLLMNTKRDDQLAMHGLSYPLSVELHETPLLLL